MNYISQRLEFMKKSINNKYVYNKWYNMLELVFKIGDYYYYELQQDKKILLRFKFQLGPIKHAEKLENLKEMFSSEHNYILGTIGKGNYTGNDVNEIPIENFVE